MRTDFLVAMPTFTSGAARTLDLYGLFDAYNESATDEIADARALFADWRIVGENILAAMRAWHESPAEAAQPEANQPGQLVTAK